VGRLQSTFPSHQLDVIIGSLLGDARLECRSVGLRSPITARFRVHHGERQKDYVFWKYGILKGLVSKGPREILWTNPKRGLREVSWYFHTRSSEEFGIIHGCFYQNGVKVLPENIFDWLTPQMIAVWFMDDGSNLGESFTLSTHGFSYEEQMRIVHFFEIRFDIAMTIVKDRDKFKLAVGKPYRRKFEDIIRSYIIPSMIYKIASPRNDLAVQTTAGI
jgi:hypothetical protein